MIIRWMTKTIKHKKPKAVFLVYWSSKISGEGILYIQNATELLWKESLFVECGDIASRLKQKDTSFRETSTIMQRYEQLLDTLQKTERIGDKIFWFSKCMSWQKQGNFDVICVICTTIFRQNDEYSETYSFVVYFAHAVLLHL